MYMALVFNSKNKLVYRLFANTEEEAKQTAREKLFSKKGNAFKGRGYKIYFLRKWNPRTLKNCSYKGTNYKNISLQLFTDYDGKTKTNIVCDGVNMNYFETIKEAFSYIKRG